MNDAVTHGKIAPAAWVTRWIAPLLPDDDNSGPLCSVVCRRTVNYDIVNGGRSAGAGDHYETRFFCLRLPRNIANNNVFDPEMMQFSLAATYKNSIGTAPNGFNVLNLPVLLIEQPDRSRVSPTTYDGERAFTVSTNADRLTW